MQNQFQTIDILARGFASRDAAMSFASRHGDTWLECSESKQWMDTTETLHSKRRKNTRTNSNKTWFGIVTVVQGSSQCLGTNVDCWSWRIQHGNSWNWMFGSVFESILGWACPSLYYLIGRINYQSLHIWSLHLTLQFSFISKNPPTVKRREFSHGNHFRDFVELSHVVMFHRGFWNWAFDSGTHSCVTQVNLCHEGGFSMERKTNPILVLLPSGNK